MAAEPHNEPKPQDLKAEIDRLKAKQSAVGDEDIRLALQGRIDALETALKSAAKQEQEPEPADLPKATAEQLTKADQLIREARVEKIRHNSSKALALLKEAAAVAPSSPAVLEAYGDDLAERRQFKEAVTTYKQALKFDPRNVGIETKLAHASLRSSSMGSIEDQLRMGDATFLTASDNVASLTTARLLNAFFPGAGHIVMGRTAGGFALLITWVACIGIVIAMHNDLMNAIHMMAGNPERPNMAVFVPIFIAAIVWIIAQTGLGASKSSARKPPPSRPTPPVDLPFE